MVTFKHKHALSLFASLLHHFYYHFHFYSNSFRSFRKSSFAQLSLSQNTEVSAGEENWWWWIPPPWYSVLSGDSSFWYKVSHCISAFEIASFWHNILGWNWRGGNELQFFSLPIWFDNQRKTLIRESLKKSSSYALGTVEPLITFCQSVKLGTTTWNQGDNL